jgi:CubicO group peptidase (beta-lactamase class C family)
MPIIRLSLALLLVLTNPTTASAVDEPLRTSQDIDAIVTQTMKLWDVPGAAVVVVRGDEVLTVSGYGVKQIGLPDPVTPSTMFPLASCTKAFTTTLMAMLVDDGRIDWDDPVRKHLPTFRLSDPNADALVTLRDIVSHRTGVEGHDLLWYHAPWNLSEVLRRAAWLPLDQPFRGAFQYSSIMVAAAGRAIANRAEQPWENLIRERITDPLGMTGVTFTTADPVFKAADRASGHRKTADGSLEVMPWYETSEPNPAGSINITPRDMVPWLKFHLANGVHMGKRLVSEANLAETKTAHIPLRMDKNLRRMNPHTVQMSYGMGWLIYDYRGKRVVAHGGKIDGFRVQVTLLPEEGIGLALFHNVHDINMNQALGNLIVDHLLGLPAKDWNAIFQEAARAEESERQAAAAEQAKQRRLNVPPALSIEDYAGTYEQIAYGTARVTVEGGNLVWSWSSFRCPLEHWEGDVFRISEGFFKDQLVEFRVTNGRSDAARFIRQVFVRRE